MKPNQTFFFIVFVRQLFTPIPGARQVFDLTVEIVQISCGIAAPFFDYAEEREQLKNWAVKKDDEGLKAYWQQKNQVNLDVS